MCMYAYEYDVHNMIVLFLIRNGHLKVVQFLVEGRYCNPEAKDRGGQTPLHHAAR